MTDTSLHKEDAPVTFREGVRGIWRHVKPYKKTVVLISVLGVISAAANGAVPYVTGRFFDALIALSHGETLQAAGVPLWGVLLGAWALVQLVANSFDWVTERLQRHVTLSVHLDIHKAGFSHLLRLPLSYHTHVPINGELSKLEAAGWRVSSLLRTIVTTVPQFLSIFIGLALAMSINITLASILAAGVAIYIAVLVRALAPAATLDSKAHTSWHESWDNAAAAVTQVHSVKQAAAEEHEEKQSYARHAETFGFWAQIDRMWSNINFYQRVAVFLIQLAVFSVSVYFVSNGSITVGDLVALNGYALMFFGPIVAFSYNWETIQNGLTAAGKIDRVFRLKQEHYHTPAAHTSGTTAGEVVFDNVSFRYEPDQPEVLSHMSFTAAPGQSVAFVGESGVGKSTAVALISAYYFPSEGTVRVDGVDTREWDLTALRQKIAVVPQEVALFNDTIRANIRYGTFDASDAEVEHAAREAHIHEFIEKQPEGYGTIVGERGIKLSVGQKQRLAIARAILRDPEFLILDEPTSALDSETERLVTESLEKLMEGRTTFIIAHRLSTVRKADVILVVKDGTIVERGSHDDLMAIPDGTYRRLYDYHVGLHE